jgi:hypothetical protein
MGKLFFFLLLDALNERLLSLACLLLLDFHPVVEIAIVLKVIDEFTLGIDDWLE